MLFSKENLRAIARRVFCLLPIGVQHPGLPAAAPDPTSRDRHASLSQPGLPGLSSARAARHMSRTALAEALGLPECEIARWETAESTPPILVAMAVARVVGTSVEHLRRPPAAC